MIEFHYETEFSLRNEEEYKKWLMQVVESEGRESGEIAYIFCDDAYLHSINIKYLNHDTFTDIISFDYTEGEVVSGDIFISVERVEENAEDFKVGFENELRRVMAHGVLHFCGFKDKTEQEAEMMRKKEEEKISMFHVEL